MQQVGRVHVLETLQALVDDVLLVDVLQNVGSDHSMQVCVHEVEHQVDVPVVLSSDYVLKSNDVLVTIQLLQEDDLTESPLSIGGVLKGIEVLLQGYNLFSPLVNGLPDDTVSSFTQLLDDLVLFEDVRFNLFRHFESNLNVITNL